MNAGASGSKTYIDQIFDFIRVYDPKFMAITSDGADESDKDALEMPPNSFKIVQEQKMHFKPAFPNQVSSKQGKDKKEDDHLVRSLYVEISLRKAMSKQHMRQIEKLKKNKKSQGPSYLNYREKVFFLDQLLDHTYWTFLSSFLKTKYVPCLFGETNDFIALDTGSKIPHITWSNTLDQITPY